MKIDKRFGIATIVKQRTYLLRKTNRPYIALLAQDRIKNILTC
jgi:hypothetical protein